MIGRKVITTGAIVLMLLVACAATTRAQLSGSTKADDPVARAMGSVEAAVNLRAREADRVLEASKLVNESAAARTRGDRARATQAITEAEKIALPTEENERSFLLDEMMRSIAAQQALLNPAKPAISMQFPPRDFSFSGAVSRSVSARLERYRETLGRILEEESVPAGLLSVAFTESGFNPTALSPKGARGIWQFMPATARRYGLQVQLGDDHRTHPEHSTHAAARYLRDLYNQFGDWKLALAAYNAGEDRVQRIIDKTGIRDFDEMARRGYLPLETRKYVPAVLAVWARLATTKPLTTANARQRGQSRGGAVEALAKPEGSAVPLEAEPKR